MISGALGVSGDPSEPPFPVCEMGIKAWVLLSGSNDRMLAKVSVGPPSHQSGILVTYSPSLEMCFWGVLTEPYALLLLLVADDIRLFAFVRFTTGDAMSKRSKFALITWIGENVSGLQRAKTGTDKTLVKEVVQVIGLVFLPDLGVTPSRDREGRVWPRVCDLAGTSASCL